MTAKVAIKEFGRYLRTCRRSRGISLKVVSQQTKISLGVLQQLENENLNNLPAPVFIKGFVKAFACAVDANPDEALHRLENYLACHGRMCATQTTSANRSGWQHRLVLSLALFAAQIGMTLYLAQSMQNPSSRPQLPMIVSQTVQAAPVASNTPEKSGHVKASPPYIEMPPLLPVASAPNLELRMTAVEVTWLKVASDNKPPQEFLLQTGQDVTLVARKGFDLVIGNAGGIRLMLDDQPVPVTGNKGQVVDLHLP